MAEFLRLTRVYERQSTGERETKPILVNLAHVRDFHPKYGNAWIRWNAPDVPDSEVIESFEAIEEMLTDGP
jgi:hypothetical protein